MKKTCFIFFLLLFIFACRVDAQWVNIGQAGFDGEGAPWMSLALDSNNVPYIAFEDVDSGADKLTVMKFTGGRWSAVGGVRGVSPGGVNYVSLAIGPDNLPYVAFDDDGLGGSGSHQACVMKYNGSQWVNVGSLDFSPGAVSSISLKFDHSGNLYIAYCDQTSYTTGIQKFSASSWSAYGVQPVIPMGGISYWVSLDFDSANIPCVAFCDGDSGGKVSVIKYNGTGWSYLGRGGFTTGTADGAVLAFSGNTPYVAFEDGNDSSKISAMKFNGSTWVNVGNPGFSPGIMDYTGSLVIDRNGTPYVAYQDGPLSQACVSKFEGANWSLVGVPDFTPDPASNLSMAIGKTGDLYIAYDPGSSVTDAPVMKYPATGVGIQSMHSEIGDISVYPNPNNGNFYINCLLPQNLNLAAVLYNSLGQKTNRWQLEGLQGNTATLSCGALPAGVYLLQIDDGAGNELRSARVVVSPGR